MEQYKQGSFGGGGMRSGDYAQDKQGLFGGGGMRSGYAQGNDMMQGNPNPGQGDRSPQQQQGNPTSPQKGRKSAQSNDSGSMMASVGNFFRKTVGGASEAIGGMVGHAMNIGGYTTEESFLNNIGVLMRTQNIEPWPAMDLYAAHLARQAELRTQTKLYLIPVELGLGHFVNHMPNYLSAGLKIDKFVSIATNLIVQQNHERPNEKILKNIFQSIDYDGNGSLSVGEWAGGLKSFFGSTEEVKNKAVFRLIDTSHDGDVDRDELRIYMTPMINAMIPLECNSLRPLIASRLLELLFREIDLDGSGKISSAEFLAWNAQNDLTKELGRLIEGPVYKVWLQQNLHRTRHSGSAVMNAMGVY